MTNNKINVEKILTRNLNDVQFDFILLKAPRAPIVRKPKGAAGAAG